MASASVGLSQALREKKFRVTQARLALLETLHRSRKPVSARHLLDALPRKLDQATAYRSLEAFTAAGLVRRVDVGHRHMHYELAAFTPHHHHFVCAECGAHAPHP